MVQSNRLNGLNPLSYLGVNPETPVPLFIRQRSPTINDYQNFTIGTAWVVTGQGVETEEIWQLVSLAEGIATWVQLYPGGGGGGASTFNCDSGAANEAGGSISILGGTNCSTTGAGDTITINLDADIPDEFQADVGVAAPLAGVLQILGGDDIHTSAAGNTVTVSLNVNPVVSGDLGVLGSTVLTGPLTAGSSTFEGPALFNDSVTVSSFGEGVVQSDSSGVLSSSAGDDGQILIGATGSAPAWANLSSTDGSIVITNTANSIDLSSVGGGSSLSFYAYQAASVSGVMLASPDYSLGTLSALTVSFDLSGAFYPGDGAGASATFTAPATGYYYLQMAGMCDRQNFSSTTIAMWVSIVTPTITTQGGPMWGGTAAPTNLSPAPQSQATTIAHLTAGDIVTFVISQPTTITAPGGRVLGTQSGKQVTYCMGYRIA